MPVSVWEAIFMLLVLKIPMVYLAAVVWWAVHAEAGTGEGGDTVHSYVPLTPCGWDDRRRRRASRRASRRPLRPIGPPAGRPLLGASASRTSLARSHAGRAGAGRR
ncbi:MAG: hypothetical protein ACRDNY_05515 [Gaiellaceae bacterium]